MTDLRESGRRRRLYRRVGLRLLLAALLVCCLCYACQLWYAPPPRALPPGVAVFWEDDAAAAKEPYTYQYSNVSRDPFPGVALSQVSVECLPRGAATVVAGGALGNRIMEVATLWTAARIHNLSAFIPPELHARLHEVFEPLGVPEASEFLSQSGCPEDAMKEAANRVRKVDLQSTSLAAAVAQAKEQHRPIIFQRWVNLPETIVPLVDEVRRHFRYQLELRKYADEKLWNLRERANITDPSIKEVVFVGVHVRRTDYIGELEKLYGSVKPADERYYGKAVLWLNYTVVSPGAELVLAVVSDDRSWAEGVLLPHLRAVGTRHSFFAGNSELGKPERDLALLSACNHSVIAYGTFGLWSALKAGGRTVVYNLRHGDAVSPAMQFAQHLPGWVGISHQGP